MRILLTVFVLMPLFSSTVTAQSAQKPKAETSSPIMAAFEILADGIRTADASKVMGVYSNSSDTLFFNNNGTATLGWEQMKSNRESAYAKASNVTLETTGVRVKMLGANAAYLTCKWKQTQQSEGRMESASGRMTLIFRKEKGEWKIVHAHTSPDVPDSSRPVLSSERQ